MNKITLDEALRARLNGLSETMEVRDENGRTVGLFVPAGVYCKMLYRIAESQCPYRAEELQAMRQQQGGGCLASLWQKLSTSRDVGTEAIAIE